LNERGIPGLFFVYFCLLAVVLRVKGPIKSAAPALVSLRDVVLVVLKTNL